MDKTITTGNTYLITYEINKNKFNCVTYYDNNSTQGGKHFNNLIECSFTYNRPNFCSS